MRHFPNLATPRGALYILEVKAPRGILEDGIFLPASTTCTNGTRREESCQRELSSAAAIWPRPDVDAPS